MNFNLIKVQYFLVTDLISLITIISRGKNFLIECDVIIYDFSSITYLTVRNHSYKIITK